jgi:hypothetical protein
MNRVHLIIAMLYIAIGGGVIGAEIQEYKFKERKKELIEKVSTYSALLMMQQFIQLQMDEREELDMDEIRNKTIEVYQ